MHLKSKKLILYFTTIIFFLVLLLLGDRNGVYATQNIKDKGMGWKFVELYRLHREVLSNNLEPKWLFQSLNENEKTAKFVDLTKYLLYQADNRKYDYGVTKSYQIYKDYQDNEFKSVNEETKGTIGWEFTKSWENNELRKYMNDDGIEYNSSTYIYSTVTKDRKSYIMHDKIGQGKGDKYYGFVHFYDTRQGYGWQHIDKFMEQGVNIKENEYNLYTESKIDVEVVDKVGLSIWEDYLKQVENIASTKNVELESYQTDCLVDMLYEGYTLKNVQQIITAFKNNGLDKSKIKAVCKEAFEGKRGDARWTLFEKGIYHTPLVGEELDPADYAGGGGEFLEVAEELWEYICGNADMFPKYGGANSGFPLKGPTVDCSAYVSWVLYNCGYSEFSWQHCTTWFIANADACASKYDWEIIKVSKGQDVSDILQAGDILVRDTGAGGGDGHMNIAVSVENGVLMAYDCGGASGWLTAKGEPIDRSYFLADSSKGGRAGVIIRGVKVLERREAGT